MMFERSFFVCLVTLFVSLTTTVAFAFAPNSYPIQSVSVEYPKFSSFQPSFVRKHAMNEISMWSNTKPRLPSSELYMSSSFSTSDEEGDASTPDKEQGGEVEVSATKLTFRERWAKAFPKKEGEQLPLRQRLAKMGLACVLSYGFVSNMNYAITTGVSWFVFAKRTGLSPLAPGQWKNFLAVYAGFWVVNNFIRPLRVGLALAISPYFDKVVLAFQNRLKVNKAVAVGITVFFANVVMTFAVLGVSVIGASALSGIPIFPPKG